MNLFLLDANPKIAAEMAVDSHVRKIILEATEMLAYAFLEQGLKFEPWPRLTAKHHHFNHPMSRAVRGGYENFVWCLEHGVNLCAEFEYRFGKQHKTLESLLWVYNNIQELTFSEYSTDWPRCFGALKTEIPKTSDVCVDYQTYYILGKKHLFKWTRREIPDFVKKTVLNF